MTMTATLTLLRLCFIVLFGAMSLMHGPVMTYFGAPPELAAAHDHAGHGEHDRPQDERTPAPHAPCNAFACFTAVEPLPTAPRPIQPVLFAIMVAAPVPSIDPVQAAPDLPPPRILS